MQCIPAFSTSRLRYKLLFTPTKSSNQGCDLNHRTFSESDYVANSTSFNKCHMFDLTRENDILTNSLAKCLGLLFVFARGTFKSELFGFTLAFAPPGLNTTPGSVKIRRPLYDTHGSRGLQPCSEGPSNSYIGFVSLTSTPACTWNWNSQLETQSPLGRLGITKHSQAGSR